MAEPLKIEIRAGHGMAAVMARKGVGAEAIGQALGLAAPTGPTWTAIGGLMLLGTGPGSWLVHAEEAAPFWADELRRRIGPLGSVCDQSGAYVVLRLAGAGARVVLRRGAAIDFHPAVFAPGTVATTVIAHIGVTVWQVDDEPTYDIAVFRSFAASFRHWLDSAAAAL